MKRGTAAGDLSEVSTAMLELSRGLSSVEMFTFYLNGLEERPLRRRWRHEQLVYPYMRQDFRIKVKVQVAWWWW